MGFDNQRFKSMRRELNLTQKELSDNLGIQQGSLSDIERGKTHDLSNPVKRILADKFKINIDYLYGISEKVFLETYNQPISNYIVNDHSETFSTKSGNIIDELPNGKYLLTVPLVPYRAQATYISEFQDAEYIGDLTKVSFVVDIVPRGRYMAFEVMNDSMNDATLEREASRSAILNGDIVLGRELGRQHWKSKLNTNGYPYWIIVHKDTIVCKEIINHDIERGIITCHSLNASPEFQDFDLKLDDCLQLFNIIKKQI